MGFLKSLQKVAKATIDVAVTPVEVVKDIATAQWAEPEGSYTGSRLEKAKQNLEDAYDALDEED
jgi:hypothetical protein